MTESEKDGFEILSWDKRGLYLMEKIAGGKDRFRAVIEYPYGFEIHEFRTLKAAELKYDELVMSKTI